MNTISTLSPLHQQYFSYLLTNSIVDSTGQIYHDYRAGSSLLFLFPYYIQLGLAQIFNVSEQSIADIYGVTSNNIPEPLDILNLSSNLLQTSSPSYLQSLFSPLLNIDRYNTLFGLTTKDTYLNENLVYTSNKVSTGPLFTISQSILIRDRITDFFNDVNYSLDCLDQFTQVVVNNDRILATLIFCQWFNYPQKLTQQVINDVELWITDN